MNIKTLFEDFPKELVYLNFFNCVYFGIFLESMLLESLFLRNYFETIFVENYVIQVTFFISSLNHVFSNLQDLNAIICVVASSAPLQKKDVKTILRTFRQTMEYSGDIIVSTVHEPDLEPKVRVTTFFILRWVFMFDNSLQYQAHAYGFIFS